MYCPNCGTQNEDGAKFCSNCGKQFSQTNAQSEPSYNTNSAQRPPKTWLVESILVTILCCLPFGIVGIINAARVESAFIRGDINQSQQYSNDAAKWTKIGFFVGLAVIIIYIIFIALGVVGGAARTFDNLDL
jgi:Predicted membrane protein